MPIPTYNDNNIGAPIPTVLYLCNGENTRCSKTNCVYSGGDCKYTTNINYAVNTVPAPAPSDKGGGK